MENKNKKKLVILGGGESGVGAAILAKDLGMEVFLSDYGHVAPRYQAVLDAEGIEWEEGRHTMERILVADEVVKSPGIAPTTPVVRAVTEKGIPVISEIEFGGRYTDSRMICITGSNGKTTTTLLTYHILRAAGIDAGLAGNVGKSLALQVAREPHAVYVIELSSFQLENMYDFRADIAIMLNITPDHLDRYDYKMENYVDAKFRILRNMTPEGAFIYWQDDPVVTSKLAGISTEARLYPFGMTRREGTRAWVEPASGELVFDTAEETVAMKRDDLSLRGLHNLYNSMAAGLASCLMKVAPDVLRRSLSDFGGVEHRLEFVAEKDGVRWINDSKATNVDACFCALDSMTAPTVLIVGGRDKGNDYGQILSLVREKCRAIVYLGADNAKLHENFDALGLPVADTHSMKECVEACARLAREGDTVLLSPCCASFDLFRNMEDRGEQFKTLVQAMM